MSEKIDLDYTPIEVAAQPPRRNRKHKWAKYLVLAGLATYLYSQTSGSGFNLLGHHHDDDEIKHPKKVIFDALEVNLAGKWSKKYTSEPHLAGTNFGLVQWTADKFEEYGWKREIDEYEIFVSYPNEQALNLVADNGSVVYEAPLKEDVLDEDATTKGEDTVPTFLGYAANGNVTAEYVYVNYGTRDDFAKLKKAGVDVKGKIAIARYGAIFRGLKVKFAQEEGAVGVLLYTDPGDDHGITPANGYKQYPHGPARQESSVQRGSVQFLGGLGSAPGDPTTPGYPSKAGAERQDPYDSIGKIPALPISYREVKPILEQLNGHGKKFDDKNWNGELEGFDYSTGPNKKYQLNLYNDQIYNISTLYNVYGEITGSTHPDEVIIIGNHRDAWIKGGAGDPNSGSAVLIEVARALGQLKSLGYDFKRTIILHSYDGEEYGLLGSTEQGEYFAQKYQKNVIAYLNLDSAVSGKHLHLSASPLLNNILREAAKEVDYPDKDVGSLYDHFVKESGDKIGNLGLGSDYAVYLDHLGIPSVDLGFGGGKGDPIYHYHSNYDSFHWISEFADKGFVFHNVAAKYLSLLIFGLSEKPIINFQVADYGVALSKYFNQTAEKVPKSWLGEKVNKEALRDYLSHDDESVEYVKQASNGRFTAHSPYPFMELVKPHQCRHTKVFSYEDGDDDDDHEYTIGDLIDHTLKEITRLRNVTEEFDIKTEKLDDVIDHWDELRWYKKLFYGVIISAHNKILHYFERNFLHHKGLDGRPWYRHIVYAGGRYTGYAGQTLPGLLEAIEDHDIDRYVHWLGIVNRTFRRINDELGK